MYTIHVFYMLLVCIIDATPVLLLLFYNLFKITGLKDIFILFSFYTVNLMSMYCVKKLKTIFTSFQEM